MNSQKAENPSSWAENPSSWPETREGRKEKFYKQIKGEGKKSFISLVIFILILRLIPCLFPSDL